MVAGKLEYMTVVRGATVITPYILFPEERATAALSFLLLQEANKHNPAAKSIQYFIIRVFECERKPSQQNSVEYLFVVERAKTIG